MVLATCSGAAGASKSKRQEGGYGSGNRTMTADSRIHFLHLPDTTPDTVGSRLHPGVKAHQITAKEIETYLQALL